MKPHKNLIDAIKQMEKVLKEKFVDNYKDLTAEEGFKILNANRERMIEALKEKE